MNKKFNNSVNFETFALDFLNSKDDIKEYLNISLNSYLKDGDFNAFYRSLELVIRAKDNISSFCKKTGVNRSNLYEIFKNKKNPRIDTLVKILDELGFSIKIA